MREPLQRRSVLALTSPAAAGSPINRPHKRVHRGLPGSGARLSCRAFVRTSRLANGSPSASRARLCRRSLHLGVSRGRPGRPSGPSRRPCRHIIFGAVSAFVAAALPREDDCNRRAGVDGLAIAMATSQQPKQRCFVGSTARTSGLGRVFGAHPRGEFRTSGAAVGQISTWSAQRTFRYGTRRTCLSSEGGHRRLCASRLTHRRLCAAKSEPQRLCAATSTPAAASPGFRDDPFFVQR